MSNNGTKNAIITNDFEWIELAQFIAVVSVV